MKRSKMEREAGKGNRKHAKARDGSREREREGERQRKGRDDKMNKKIITKGIQERDIDEKLVK